jgi:hypothetical protein
VYVPVSAYGARRKVPSNSTPTFVVLSTAFVRTYAVERSTSMGCSTRDAKSVAVSDAAPIRRVMSTDALPPRSATSGLGTASRVSPAASVSSVRTVRPKNPVPADSRAVPLTSVICWRSRNERQTG